VHIRCTGFLAINRDAPPCNGCCGTSRHQTSRRDSVLSARRITLRAAVPRPRDLEHDDVLAAIEYAAKVTPTRTSVATSVA
jgi:hypothetical protein